MSILKTKPYKSVDAGQFHFNFYYKEGSVKDTYLEVTCDSGIFAIKIGGNTHAYGYLLAAAEQNRIDQLQGYAVTLYIPAMSLTQDQGLCNDCQKAIMKWQKRKMREGAENAKKVTDAEEMASQAFMESVVERSQMNKKEAKAASESDRKMMREVLNEKEEENGE